MKKIISLTLCCVMVLALAACGSGNSGGKGSSMNKPKVEISVKNFGKMQFELDPTNAPETVDNFIALVERGFYTNLTFHRIISGFMIQGGDPKGNGTGGSEHRIVGEFESNGYDNKIEHRRGVISMARSSDPNSASSQFFICHEDSTFLDGHYAGFGYILKGIEVVDKICEEVRVLDDNGTVNKVEQPVIEYIKVIK